MPTRLEFGAPAGADIVAVMMHGRGGSPEDMRNLAAALDCPFVRFIFPRAPEHSWYPKSFLSKLTDNEPKLSASLAACGAIIDELERDGVAPGQIVLGGFSQGACMTAELLLRRPRRYGAAVILTGGMIGPPDLARTPPPELAGLPVYLSGSKVDEWIPVQRTHATADILRAAGADVTLRVFDNRPHMVTDEEIRSVRDVFRIVEQTAAS